MKDYLITFRKISKYHNEPEQTCKVKVSRTTGDVGQDSKSALDVFLSAKGSLKKNEIIKIQELDESGAPVGEPITPMEDTSIVPTGR